MKVEIRWDVLNPNVSEFPPWFGGELSYLSLSLFPSNHEADDQQTAFFSSFSQISSICRMLWIILFDIGFRLWKNGWIGTRESKDSRCWLCMRAKLAQPSRCPAIVIFCAEAGLVTGFFFGGREGPALVGFSETQDPGTSNFSSWTIGQWMVLHFVGSEKWNVNFFHGINLLLLRAELGEGLRLLVAAQTPRSSDTDREAIGKWRTQKLFHLFERLRVC